MEDRVILHCDLNNFFASVETLGRPKLQAVPVAVCGDPERRHGIILAKNEPAKRYGIKTGEALLTAKAKCRDLVLLPAHNRLYMCYSDAMRELYRRYTDRIESFGIDECWLDVTGSARLFGDGLKIANELRALARAELGLTISAGISFNKTFAKMGSDYRKPDASTLITRENYRELLWGLPVEDFLFVGRSTAEKLHIYGVSTIGDLAGMDRKVLEKRFGLPGLQLHAKANGFDPSPVARDDYRRPPQSIGNSVTCPRDVREDGEIRTVLFMLCDSVATRLRRHAMRAKSLTLWLRAPDLTVSSFRTPIPETELSTVLFEAAYRLYKKNHADGEPLRGLGITAEKLVNSGAFQISFLDDTYDKAKKEQLEKTVDELRTRFGREVIGGGLYLLHPELTLDHPLGHRLHPGSYDDSEGYEGEKG